MLVALARRVSDKFLPEAFYDSTFANADGYAQRSPDEEEELAMSLDHKIGDSLVKQVGEDEESDDSGDG
jgi:hypothetical protein